MHLYIIQIDWTKISKSELNSIFKKSKIQIVRHYQNLDVLLVSSTETIDFKKNKFVTTYSEVNNNYKALK